MYYAPKRTFDYKPLEFKFQYNSSPFSSNIIDNPKRYPLLKEQEWKCGIIKLSWRKKKRKRNRGVPNLYLDDTKKN